MINAWSLLDEELNGIMAKTYPIEDNDMSPCKLDDPIFTVGSGNTASASTNTYYVDTTQMGDIKIDTSALDDDLFASMDGVEYTVPTSLSEPICTANLDDIVFPDNGEYETLNINIPDDSPLVQNFLADNDDAVAHHFTTPKPGIKNPCNRKYKEDESIKALQDYISTTYGGHYTSDQNNVQTLDLIESVGDAESFCRSNAIKYLSRYDKKGQAKRDILKALHYTLLLYHFSGQLNETPTRGYETF